MSKREAMREHREAAVPHSSESSYVSEVGEVDVGEVCTDHPCGVTRGVGAGGTD